MTRAYYGYVELFSEGHCSSIVRICRNLRRLKRMGGQSAVLPLALMMAVEFFSRGFFSVLLELAKPVSLLASIFSLLAVFHAAFLGSEEDLGLRILNAAGMAVIAGAFSLASGLVFTQQSESQRSKPLKRALPAERGNVLPFRRPIRKSAQDLYQPSFGFQGVIESFPMRIFYWSTGTMAALFLAAWFIETYCIPLSRLH
jgi:hypothetical protein